MGFVDSLPFTPCLQGMSYFEYKESIITLYANPDLG